MHVATAAVFALAAAATTHPRPGEEMPALGSLLCAAGHTFAGAFLDMEWLVEPRTQVYGHSQRQHYQHWRGDVAGNVDHAGD